MKLFASFLLIISTVSALAEASEVCNGVLELAGMDKSSKQYVLSTAEWVHEELCAGDSVKAGLEISVPMAALLDGLPTDLVGTIGGKVEKSQQLCKNFRSWKSLNYSSSEISSTAVRESIVAWAGCMKFSNASINVQPGRESIVITISRGKENALFTGVKPSNSRTQCKVQKKTASGRLVEVDSASAKNFPITLTPSDVNVYCSRTPTRAAGIGEVYDRVELTIMTSRGSLLLPVARDTAYSVTYASELELQLEHLRSELKKLSGESAAAHATLQKLGKATPASLQITNALGNPSNHEWADNKDCGVGFYVAGVTAYGRTQGVPAGMGMVSVPLLQAITLRCLPVVPPQ